ncbi:hypothetical protein BDV25DRAFT_79745 [Aspergillus avenaceus]|uniref:Uncharacterized protein n=1 Tax=Aspergillus avenaceus TaxID=36643 RepID=A0A5N6TF26_ASPAV|nr:hypothetical protein BDV25DRAFT_79745 [Aspergillus avenaceus]
MDERRATGGFGSCVTWFYFLSFVLPFYFYFYFIFLYWVGPCVEIGFYYLVFEVGFGAVNGRVYLGYTWLLVGVCGFVLGFGCSMSMSMSDIVEDWISCGVNFGQVYRIFIISSYTCQVDTPITWFI